MDGPPGTNQHSTRTHLQDNHLTVCAKRALSSSGEPSLMIVQQRLGAQTVRQGCELGKTTLIYILCVMRHVNNNSFYAQETVHGVQTYFFRPLTKK